MKLNHTQTNINLKLDKSRCFAERNESFDRNNMFLYKEKWASGFFLQKLIQAYFCHSWKLATHFFSNLAREVAGYSAGGPGSILASLKKFLNQVFLA